MSASILVPALFRRQLQKNSTTESGPIAVSMLLFQLLACGPLIGEQSQLFLTTGSSVQGDLIENSESVVRLSQLFDAPDGLVEKPIDYPHSSVRDIVALEPEYQKRLSQATESADDQAALAEWCRWAGYRERALAHARSAYASDRNHVIARRVLAQFGWIEVDGKLVLEKDYLLENHLEHFQGALVSDSDKVKLQQAEQDCLSARHNAFDARTQAEHERSLISSSQRKIAAISEELAELQEPTKAQMQAAKALIAQAQKDVDAANRPQGHGRNRHAPGPDSRQIDALKEAHALSASLESQAATTKQERELQTASRVSLQQTLQNQQAALPALERAADATTQLADKNDSALALMKTEVHMTPDPRLVSCNK